MASREWKIKDLIRTTYGTAQILELRYDEVNSNLVSMIIAEPIEWELANSQKPRFYLNPSEVQPFLKIGQAVRTAFGLGSIVDYRKEDEIYRVTLRNWELATKKSPVLYVNVDSLVAVNLFDELYKMSLADKESAKKSYVAADYGNAAALYASAVERLNGLVVHGNIDDLEYVQRGQFFELSVTCNTNIACCFLGVEKPQQAIQYATNAVNLVNAMEEKVKSGSSELWETMVASGLTHTKLGDWCVKAQRVIGKAEQKRKNWQLACNAFTNALDKAMDIITLLSEKTDSLTKDTPAYAQHMKEMQAMEKSVKELKDLQADMNRRIEDADRKEKALWKKAFKKGNNKEESLYADPESIKKAEMSADGNKKMQELLSQYKLAKPVDTPIEEEMDNTSSTMWYSGLAIGVLGLAGAAAWLYNKRPR